MSFLHSHVHFNVKSLIFYILIELIIVWDKENEYNPNLFLVLQEKCKPHSKFINCTILKYLELSDITHIVIVPISNNKIVVF